MIRVALIDDHALVRAGVRGELEESENSDVEVVAEAGTVADAIDAIVRSKPDVVVCDVHLPDGTAADVIAGVVERGVTSRFLALSVSDAATDVIHVIRSGARGYVTKAIEGPDLVNAVRRVNDGDAVFSPRLAGFVLDAFSANLESPGNPELDELTAREQEVMRLLARGYAYKEIARRLSISIKTVESHASAVLRKLQLSSRNELAAWAANRKLV
ncbi:MAG: response regulator transcription factor [Acidimicrobiia bacterium]|nr:response regulator transcription factor [Acidimicrobiia bacterium]MDH5520805.1 response regulator transcription factor [Acidimicrobiia bacterium]